jgi:ABC-type transporter Mla MlaB component
VTTLHIGRLEVEITGERAVLVGRIDDSVSLSDLPSQLPAAGPVSLDTSGVTFVNSIGMREWMRLTRALRERGNTITLERVADVLMTQLNLFGDLARMATIASFHAQYVCPACGAEAMPVVDVAQHAPLLRAQQAPHLPCPECRAAMDLGDFPERYLSVFKG